MVLSAGEVMMTYSSNWFTPLLLCTSASLVSCCNQFDRGSRQVKHEPVDLVMEDYDVSLRQRICSTDRFIGQSLIKGAKRAQKTNKQKTYCGGCCTVRKR